MTDENTICHKKGCTNPAIVNLAFLVKPIGSETPVQIFTETYVCRHCASDQEAKVILNKSPSIRSEIRKSFIRAGLGIPDFRGAVARWVALDHLQGVKPNFKKKPEIILH